MTALVTLAEAKAYCRVLTDDEDAIFAILIAGASEAVRTHADDWDGTLPVPDRLKLATLSRIAIAYDDRADLSPAKGEANLLSPLRKLGV